MPFTTLVQGFTSRLRGDAPLASEGNPQSPRFDIDGVTVASNLFNGMQQAGLDGSLYQHVNEGTRLTGINISTTTNVSYSATNAILVVANTNPVAPGSPSVVLDQLEILVDAIAGGAPTFWHWYHAMDSGNRYASGATSPGVTNTTANAYGSAPNGIQVYSGAITAAAATGQVRDIGHNLMANGASVANSVYRLKYGCQEAAGGAITTPTTAVGQFTNYGPTVVIPPGFCYVLNELWVGRTTTALTGEISLSFIVR